MAPHEEQLSMTNDLDEPDVKRRLQQALGDRYDDGLLRRVMQAEDRMVDRKDALVDMLDAGVIREDEYAAKINRVMSVFLREIAGIIGPDACERIYDFGPNDDIELVDAKHVTAQPQRPDEILTAQIVAVELTFASDRLRIVTDRDTVERGWIELIRSSSAAADLQAVVGAGNRKMVLCQRASELSRYLISNYDGEIVDDTAWRIAAKILAIDDLVLGAAPEARHRFIQMLRNSAPKDFQEWLYDNTFESRIRALVDTATLFP